MLCYYLTHRDLHDHLSTIPTSLNVYSLLQNIDDHKQIVANALAANLYADRLTQLFSNGIKNLIIIIYN